MSDLWDGLGTPLYPHVACPICADESEVGSHFDAAWCCNCGTLGSLTRMREDWAKQLAETAARHGMHVVTSADLRAIEAWRAIPEELLGLWAGYSSEHVTDAMRAEVRSELARRGVSSG